jgi:uncharacterized membrane protein YsdA (DUF1294 family)
VPLPPWLAVYAIASLVTFLAYGLDKRRAQRGGRRVPEATLHLLELCGGWPGALVAQQVFRHKRRKARYLAAFAAIVALHIAALAWLFGDGIVRCFRG